MNEKKKILNRDVIKYLAVFAMTLNHIAEVFLTPGTLLRETLIIIGYFTAVTMCYFLVEGYEYTRSKKKYGFRLLIFAILSEIPFCVALSPGNTITFIRMNMVFTLLLCFLVLEALHRPLEDSQRKMLLVGLVLASLCSDWGIIAPVMTYLFARAKGDRVQEKKIFLWLTVWFGVICFAEGFQTQPIWFNLLRGAGGAIAIAASGFCLLYLYNGKRASFGQTFSKWFFYLYYPLHLAVIGWLKFRL